MLKKYTAEFNTNLKLAYPVMLGQLGHMLVGLADTVMIGKLGDPKQLAATSLAGSVLFVFLSFGIGFSFAITPFMAEAHAKNDVKQGRRDFQHGFVLSVLLALFMLVVVFFAKPILSSSFFNQPKEVVELAIPYLNIAMFSMLPVMIFQALKQFSDGLSFTKYAMYATFIANGINVLVNYFLIYGIWVFPRLEIVGAALGTLISRIGLVIVLYLFLRKNKTIIPYLKPMALAEFKKSRFIRFFKIGIPTALQMFFEVSIFLIAVWFSGMLGVNEQAANSLTLQLASTTFMIAIGVAVATTIRVGNQKGFKNYRKLRELALSNLLLIFAIEAVFTVLFIVLNNYLPTLFFANTDLAIPKVMETVAIASQLLIVAGFFQLSDGVQVVILGALRGLQDVKAATIITFITYWVFALPIIYYLGFHTSLKTTGIWIGLLIGLTLSAVILYIRFDYLTKKLIKEKDGLA